MAAGDIYKASEAQTNASQREALAALARGGTAEKDAYLASQKAQQDDQARIMQEILARATAIGAPAGAAAEQQAGAQPGFDRRALALAAAQGSGATALDQISKANSNYFDQVNAAVPIVKARSDEINAANALKAQQEEADRQLRLQLADMQLAEAQARLGNTVQSGRNAAAKASGGGDLSDSELRTRLTGAARATAEASPLKNLSVFGVRLPQLSESARARNIGVESGIDPARVFGLINPPKAAKAPTTKVTPAEQTRRIDVINRVRQHASDKTAGLVVNIVADASNFQKALALLAEEDDKDLKKAGISRQATERWLRDYYGV